MTEIEQKAVEKMADRIGKFYNYQITQSDTYELAKFLYAAGYRKRSDTVKEFAQKSISRVFEGITQRFCDCYNDGLLRGYPDSELSRNFLRAFDECKDIAEKEINDLAEQFGREE